MPNTQLPSASLPVFAPGDKIEVKGDGFYLNNKKWFMIGGNWRIIGYAQNFGVTAWFPTGNGISKHPNFVKVSLDYIKQTGIKVVRVGLLEDGRTVFNKDGRVTGYDEIFRRDVRDFLDLVNEANIKVEFTLFDYLIAGKPEEVSRVWLRGRSNVITDEEVKDNFISQFLTPFLNEFEYHPALIGFDVINEPEWVISREDGGGWDDYHDLATKAEEPVSGEAMKIFITDCIETLREYAPTKLITVGTCAKFIPLVMDLDIDYFALHHYPWMYKLRAYLRLQPIGKPWSLEEFPTRATPISIPGYLNLTLEAGGTGATLWNLTPQIDKFTFSYSQRDAKLLELRNWVDMHAQDIYCSDS